MVRLLLEAYYEPQFSDRSYGFRPSRGCHTALSEVVEIWKGTQIKSKIAAFPREEIKLELSQSKTLITHATSQAAHSFTTTTSRSSRGTAPSTPG